MASAPLACCWTCCPTCGSAELLALRCDSIDVVTLDRYGCWPDLEPPKNGTGRTARLSQHHFDVAASPVADALAREGEQHGWLFPRRRSVTK